MNFQGDVTGGNAPFEYFRYFGGAPNSDKQNPGNVVFSKPDNPDDVNRYFLIIPAMTINHHQPVSALLNQMINSQMLFPPSEERL